MTIKKITSLTLTDKNGNGGYENRVEEDTYNEWLVNR